MTSLFSHISRRDFLMTGTALAAAMRAAGAASSTGQFLNPIFRGDYPDAGILRVDGDYYITHTSLFYTPGLIVWRSRDMVNWQPVCAALTRYHGEIWAPYLCEHKGRYYIYFPCNGRLTVVYADSPRGPWSNPIDLGIRAIDPAHMAAADGKRHMFFAGGRIADLADDGLSVTSSTRRNFDPWPMPMDWNIECTCLEAPKLFRRGEYYYLTVAQGGTSGPATSHCVISARSRSLEGPWEYSPYNPIARTRDIGEKWWSKGHGRLVEAADGSWWMTLHAYENGFRTLGRHTLLLPIEWTPNGWFHVPAGIADDKAIALPWRPAAALPRQLSDDFNSAELRMHWQFWKGYDPGRFRTGDAQLVLNAHGTSAADTSVLTCISGDHTYTVEVDVEIEPGCEAGLLLFYNEAHSLGLRLGPAGIGFRKQGDLRAPATRALLRIVNDRQEAAFFYKCGAQPWARVREAADMSHYHTNNFGGFLDLRPALYAAGAGRAIFRSFRYATKVENPFAAS